MSSWQRWRGLPRAERAETLRAAVLIPLCPGAIHVLGLAPLLRVIAARAQHSAAEPRLDMQMSVRAVDRACAYGATGACLTRSGALMYLLARHGRVTELKIGAQRVPSGLAAHAWVEADGVALNDRANLRDAYTLLAQTQTAA